MGHPLAYIPPSPCGWRAVEITARTIRGTLLLRPSAKLCDRVYGVLGRAQRKTGVRIHAFTYLSNHWHLIASVRDSLQLADFLRRVQGQVTVELRTLVGWIGPAWSGRCKKSLLTHEEENLSKRLRYVLSQGCKEGLVKSPLAWPGPSSTRALCDGSYELHGTWIDRSLPPTAKANGAESSRRETVRLSKLPGFEHLTRLEYSCWVKRLVDQITEETRARHLANRTKPLGVWRICRMSPFRVPRKVAWGPRPRILGGSVREEKELFLAYASVVADYYEAKRLRDQSSAIITFPAGTFPSPRSFGAARAGPQ